MKNYNLYNKTIKINQSVISMKIIMIYIAFY